MTRDNGGLALEHFIQAVQSQLDNAQTAMAVKARNLNLPLTFAIKDITLDLRAHVEIAQSEVRVRPAAPNEKDASVLHLVFTAITRPAIEENAVALGEDPEDQPIDELGEDLSDEDRRRLGWVGVRTVSKLRQIEEQGESRTVNRVTSLPLDRLRRALARAATPLVDHVLPVSAPRGAEDDLPPMMRVRGRNLRAGGRPRITIGGRPVTVVKGDDRELLLAPAADQWAGELAIESPTALPMAMSFDLSAFAPPPAAAAVPPLANGHARVPGAGPDGAAQP